LKPKEVEFLVGHEVLHVVYDHMGRIGKRDPQIFNIANDYAVNADLKRHNVGQFITSVPCLYEKKYDGKSSEEIYDDLMKNAKHIDINSLIDQMIDDHMEGEGEGEGDGEGDKKGKGRPKMSDEERERVRQEIKQAIISAASSAEAGQLPLGVERLIKQHTNPVMPWRELIQQNLTSCIRTDYSWMRPSRRGWHMDAIMPGMTPGEEIDVVVTLDMSGSISNKQAQDFLGEIGGMMNSFDGYKVHLFCFDTDTYNPQDFNSENMDCIDEYEPQGGGGTDFDCIFKYLKENDIQPKRLIVFTDGYPCGSWGSPDYCDTTWIIHGDPDPHPPFGQFALYDGKVS
jgi:predicted metal-dependent peptidase